jgi:putative ABC transport system permease protein
LVGLAVAYLISFNRLSTAFEGRMWQIGILRAVGVSMRSVWIDLMKEGILLGAGGVLIGVPLGIAIARIVLPIVATTTALNYKLIAPDVQLAIRVSSLILAAACGMGTALVAAALPAARAARMTAVEILRGRGVEHRAGRSRATRLTVVGGAAIVVGVESRVHSPLLGIVATVLIALATAVVARPFVRFMEGRLFPLLARIFGPAGRFAGAVLRQSRRRTALTVATLALGLGTVCWLWVVGKSFEQSVIEVLSSAFRSDLVVSSSHVESGAFEAPVSKQLLSELARVPGVRAVAGERVVDWHYGGAPLVIEAFDGSYLDDSDFGRWPLMAQSIPDPWDAVARGEGFVVSSTLVRRTAVRVGDRVVLETPAGSLSLPVVGVTMDFASPQGTLKMLRPLYERLWHDDTITLAFVEADAPARIEDVRMAIAATLGSKYQLRILSARELVEYYGEQVRRAFGAVDALAVMVLVVVLVGVADAVAASVMERTRELGVIRAVGVGRKTLWKSIMLEGLALAIMGITLGIAAGALLGVLWVEDTFPALLGWVLVLHVPYAIIACGAALTIVVCLAASALPARRAARLEAATALRYE